MLRNHLRTEKIRGDAAVGLFFGSALIKWGALALGALLVLSLAYGAGWTHQGNRLGLVVKDLQAQHLQQVLAAEQGARDIELARADAARAMAKVAHLRNQEREVTERIITNEVIQYVRSDAGAVHCLDADGVRIHNASAASEVPPATSPTTQPDGTSRGSSAAEVIQVVAENYATCHAWADRLTGLQAWVGQVLILAIDKREK